MRLLLALMLLALPAAAQSKGLLDSIKDGFDPSKDRRGGKPKTSDPHKAPEADRAGARAPVKPAPAPERLEEHLKRLEGVRYGDVQPVQGPKQVEERIRQLRRRARRQRMRADAQTNKTVAELEERARKMRGKWQPVIDALKDGKERSAQEWSQMLDRARGLPVEPKPAPPPAPPADDADELLGLEDEKDEPKEAPPPKPVKAPDLTDLKKAIEGHEKPAGMHPLTWLALQEEFERDLRDLRTEAAVARKKLADQRRRDYEPVAEALKAAERTFENLKKLGGAPPEWMRRQLAWRLHQARLEQLRLAVSDQKAMAKERGGEASGRPTIIEMYPLDPARTLNQIARLIETSGEPGAPGPDAFDSLKEDGLPPLYPKGSKTILDDKSVHYGNLVKANIDRYHRSLKELKARLADAAKRIEREDKRAMRRYAADLYQADRLAGQLYIQPARDKRRDALKKKWAEYKATRAARIEQERQRLQEMIDGVTKRLEAEYKRRDAMLKAEKPPGKQDD